MNNNKGLTLLELIVYMALAVLLLVPVVMLMNTSSKNMVRSASSTEMRMSGGDVLNILYDEIKNTGFKLNPASSGFTASDSGWYRGTIISGASPAMRDSSSFRAINGDGLYDSLIIIRGRPNDSWTAFGGADTLAFFVENQSTDKNLVRMEVGLNGATRPATRQVLARNVVALQFQYACDNILATGGDWVNGFAEPPTPATAPLKKNIKYIKVAFIMKNDRQVAAARSAKIEIGDTSFTPQANDLSLYERHEIVIPIPNNGLFPSP